MASKRGGRRVSGSPARRPAERGKLGREERFSETREQFEARLRRDKVIGLVGVALAGVVLLLNLVMELDASLRLLPGGHSELYFLAGLVVLFASCWVAFDWGNKRRVRR